MSKQITVDKDKCIGCGLCVLCCEDEAITLFKNKAYITMLPICINCKDCIDICSFSAINLKESIKIKKSNTNYINEKKLNTIDPLNTLCLDHKIVLNQKDKHLVHSLNIVSNILPALNPYCLSRSTKNCIKDQAPYDLKLIDEDTLSFDNTNVLIAANCVVNKQLTKDLAKNRLILVGCPKEEDQDYITKLTTIIDNNNIRNISIILSEHDCCQQFKEIVKKAIINSQKTIPWNILFIK